MDVSGEWCEEGSGLVSTVVYKWCVNGNGECLWNEFMNYYHFQ